MTKKWRRVYAWVLTVGNGLIYGKSADYHCKGSIDTELYREERSNQCNDC